MLVAAGIASPADPTKPNEEPEPENPTPPEEEEASEPEQEEEDPQAAPEEGEEDPKGPSRREQLRINQLLSKYPNLREQTEEKPKAEQPKSLDLEKELEADPEVIQKLQQDRQAIEAQAYARGRQEANSLLFHTRLEIDAPRVEAKFPVLDKSSPKFNPQLATALNTMFLDAVGFKAGDPQKGIPDTVQRPNIRYADYMESLFELSHEMGQLEVAESKKNITRQAARTGLRPDGSKAKKLDLTKPPEQMTDEELDAIIAQAIPPAK